jgi:hypothetical protein
VSGQHNLEEGAAAGGVPRQQHAAVLANDALGDGEAETGAV